MLVRLSADRNPRVSRSCPPKLLVIVRTKSDRRLLADMGSTNSLKSILFGTASHSGFRALAIMLIIAVVAWVPVTAASALPSGFIGSANRPQNDGYWLATTGGVVRSFG